MKLVIVESPAKAKTINKYLGKGFSVAATMGHVKDLPKSSLSVDVEHDYEPLYEVMSGKKKVLPNQKKLSNFWKIINGQVIKIILVKRISLP